MGWSAQIVQVLFNGIRNNAGRRLLAGRFETRNKSLDKTQAKEGSLIVGAELLMRLAGGIVTGHLHQRWPCINQGRLEVN